MKKKLKLQPFKKEDIEFFYQMRTNPDVSNYWCKEPYLAMEQIETAYLASPNNDSHRPFVLMYKDRKVGYLSLYAIDFRHRHAGFSIMIDPAEQGNGYATSASRLLIDYGFNQLNLHKLYLHVVKQNEKAIHIYKKVGFQIEGDLKKHYFVDGQYCDCYIMGLFQTDYNKKSQKK